ncbi:hypothetical protein BOTBODRAFT_63062 [Botryobasidium botryosum FD-172 SS1]|uniref:Methyltransferase domain-containing protein n=1 Tax=Botryobasidium botryosum (strain FD-172 SS1) TaxID=930990 RepID=A0A067MTI3_BOTB1|nr:hypothetical protein BOTBODRAFT_63062 [Botryobasidium botryosum FD-172 SS1]
MELVAEKNESYGIKEYWDERYRKEAVDASFDWFKSYNQIASLIAKRIPDKSSRILMLGCGNSTLSEEMWDDGYKNIVNIDYSSVCIENMRRRNLEKRPNMEWLEMDVRKLEFEPESFDIVIDKGTMDSMMTTKGDVWNPPEDVIQNCTAEVDEVVRVLRRPAGTFIYLTFGQPHFRKRYLNRPECILEVTELGEAFHYYCYVMRFRD